MNTSMDELIERFRAETIERMEAIEALMQRLEAGSEPAEPADEIRDHAHKLKGAAGVLGFPELKDRAADLEEVAASQATAADSDTAAGALRPVVGALEAALPA